MIMVRLFASIREALGTDSLELESAGLATVEDVVDALCSRGDIWEEVLRNQRVLVAINQEMTSVGARVIDGDEVALFPPVTGG